MTPSDTCWLIHSLIHKGKGDWLDELLALCGLFSPLLAFSSCLLGRPTTQSTPFAVICPQSVHCIGRERRHINRHFGTRWPCIANLRYFRMQQRSTKVALASAVGLSQSVSVQCVQFVTKSRITTARVTIFAHNSVRTPTRQLPVSQKSRPQSSGQRSEGSRR